MSEVQPAGGQRLETSARTVRRLPFRATPWTAWARRSAWLLWAATLVVAAVGLALMGWDWSTPVPRGFFGVRGFAGLYAVGFGGVGALLTWRRPSLLVGWILAAIGLVEAVDFATFEYGLAASAGRTLPGSGYVGWVQRSG